MSRIILDIETSGKGLDSLDPAMREYMLRGAESKEDEQEVRESLSLYPLTGEVVAIGLLNPDSLRGAMLYQAPGEHPRLPLEEEGVAFEAFTDEKSLLLKFWDTIKGYAQVVTYNGRGFDCPYIIVRSAAHRIKPTKELMPNRYSDDHLDLMDRLGFFGAVRRRFSLDMWCRAFGIESPKEKVSGKEVPGMFREGRYLEIARYCARDLFATRELLLCWEQYFRP
jgi:DNA polymerase elongation subunit (family B)